MSNRMVTSYRIPMITDPVTAGYASMAFTASRARVEQAVRVGESFAMLLGGIQQLFDDLSSTIDSARNAQELFALSDKALAARGLLRSDIPAAVWQDAPPVQAG
ncbi:MAG: hypothetical protein GEU92_01430 [Alphaproteobacteria bacterium]|nr:hypothetical protein [Alphaproteobacteria bacterium]